MRLGYMGARCVGRMAATVASTCLLQNAYGPVFASLLCSFLSSSDVT